MACQVFVTGRGGAHPQDAHGAVALHGRVDVRGLAVAKLAEREEAPGEEKQIVIHSLLPVWHAAGRLLRLERDVQLLVDDVHHSLHEARIEAALLAEGEAVAEHGEDKDTLGVRRERDGLAARRRVVQRRAQHAHEVRLPVVLDNVLQHRRAGRRAWREPTLGLQDRPAALWWHVGCSSP